MTPTHFHRRGRYGRTVGHLVLLVHPEVRFWRKVAKGPSCWVWEGAFDAKGYGRLVIDRKEVRAHRFAYELANGPIPAGLHVLWRCGNPRCVRADHLFLGRAPITRATGEASVHAKLTEVEVKEIRSRAAAGETMAKLAMVYGVSKTTVWRVVKGETWSDV